MDIYSGKFKKIHELLKEYGCKRTFSFHPEYREPVIIGGSFFYQPEEDDETDHIKKEWGEKVDAKLDVVIAAKKRTIRFDIEWSQKAKLYSMYISLPTSDRSESLSHKRFKNQEDVIAEIMNWLKKFGCKKIVKNQNNMPEKYIQPKQLELWR